jgi:hypothetical protein
MRGVGRGSDRPAALAGAIDRNTETRQSSEGQVPLFSILESVLKICQRQRTRRQEQCALFSAGQSGGDMKSDMKIKIVLAAILAVVTLVSVGALV